MAANPMLPDTADYGAGAPLAEINTTPFVDVLLVLVVVFMVLAPTLNHSIKVKLPEVAKASSAETPQVLRLEIGAQGQYRLDGRSLSLVALSNTLGQAQHGSKNAALHLYVDKQASYQVLAAALAAAEQQGIHNIGFVTAVEPTKPL